LQFIVISRHQFTAYESGRRCNRQRVRAPRDYRADPYANDVLDLMTTVPTVLFRWERSVGAGYRAVGNFHRAMDETSR